MKLKTNLFQGKKSFLDEGQMIYTVNDEENIINGAERSRNCRICRLLMKLVFYVLLLFFILFLVWIGFMLISETLASAERMCGTGLYYDYLEPMDSDFNSTEIDDIIMNTDRSEQVMNYANDIMEIETATDINEASVADVKSITYAEAKNYMARVLERQIDAADD